MNGNFDLNAVRKILSQLDVVILLLLLEKSNYGLLSEDKEDNIVYLDNFDGCFLIRYLNEIEKLYFKKKNLRSKIESNFLSKIINHPFFSSIEISHDNYVDLNHEIIKLYITKVLPLISSNNIVDPETVIKSCFCDIKCLQAILKRVNYGKLVAELKFQQNTKLFNTAVKNKEIDKILDFITDEEVQEKVIKNLRSNFDFFLNDTNNRHFVNIDEKISFDVIESIFKNTIIPLTKKSQFFYLINRSQ